MSNQTGRRGLGLPDNLQLLFPSRPVAQTEAELIDTALPCDDLHAIDLDLWRQLRYMAKNSPRQLAAELGLRQTTVELLADAEDERIYHLASGVFCSVRLVVPEMLFSQKFRAVKTLQSSGAAGAGRRQVITTGGPLSGFAGYADCTANHLTYEYLRYARDVAKKQGIASARVKFDLPEGILGRLTYLTDVEIRTILPGMQFGIKIRCDEAVLCDLLTSEITTHFKLCQYASILKNLASEPLTRLAEYKAYRGRLKSLEAANTPRASTAIDNKAEEARREDLAVAYFRLGLHTAAIREIFQFSESVLSRVRKFATFYGDIPKSRNSSGAFISNHPTQMHANLLACIYTELAPGYESAVNVPALFAALEIFYAIREETGTTNQIRWPLITPSKAYCLVGELVRHTESPDSASAYESSCVVCDLPVFVWLGQKRTETKICCYCQLGDARRINSA